MAENFDDTKYRTGYSIGVGGVVLFGDKILLVRSAFGKREWSIPGGFVEPDETIDKAIQREIMEETGVQAELQGLIGARNRVSSGDNSAYFIFLLHSTSEETQADGVEVTEARYFTAEDVEALTTLNALSQMVVKRVFEQRIDVLAFSPHPSISPNEYVLYI